MKRRIGVVLLAAGLPALAAAPANKMEGFPRDEQTGKYTLQGVVTVEGVAADELYARAHAWIATTYASAKDVIQLADKDTGRIIAKGSLPNSYMGAAAWFDHTLTIEVKEGRFRYSLTDFAFDNGHWSAPLEDERAFTVGFKKTIQRFRQQATDLVEELTAAMMKPAAEW